MARLRVASLVSVIAASALTLNVRAQSSGSLTIVRVTIVDVVGGRTIPDSIVTIESGVIGPIRQGGNAEAGAEVYDAEGRFLIPGLWDMHAHLQMSGESSLATYLANGVTGVRDMGSDADVILPMRESTASGRVPGPRIVAAGPVLDDAPEGWPNRVRVRTAEEGRAAVRMLKGRGVDLIKVHDRTPREAYLAIAEESRRLGLPLAGHVPRGVSYDEAIDAGQSSIEHLANLRLFRPCSGGAEYRAEPCRPFFETLARRGVWQTPTIQSWRELMSIGTPASGIPADQLSYVSESMKTAWAMNQQVSRATPEMVRALVAASEVAAVVTSDMQRAGVGILAGCDGMVPGFCVHDELALMVRGGMSPVAALQTATINPARYLKREQSLGTVERGRIADLILLDANPLDDIGNVRRIRAVVKAGRLLKRPELDAMLARAKGQR